MTILIHILPAHAQPTWQPKAPQYVQCPAPGQPLLRIPELVSLDGKLRATMLLNNNVQRMFLGANDLSSCLPQDVRQFRGVNATLPAYNGFDPARFSRLHSAPSYPGFAPVPDSQYFDPVPGPTLRARVGDLIELSFLNQIGGGPYWNTIDRGEKGQGCDEKQRPLSRPRHVSGLLSRVDHGQHPFPRNAYQPGHHRIIHGDLTRRAARAKLDPNTVDPLTRVFTSNPVQAVLADRGRYVSAILTIEMPVKGAARERGSGHPSQGHHP